MLTRPRSFLKKCEERGEELQPTVAESLQRSRARQQEVAAGRVRKTPTAKHDQRGYWEDPAQTLQDLRRYGEFLRLHKVELKTACIVTGIVQATALCMLATTSWMLPWLIPSVSVGFVLVVGLLYFYVTDKSETAIIVFICSCAVLFTVACADLIALQYCHGEMEACFEKHMIAIPSTVILVQPLMAMAGIYLAVFKTAYVPKRVEPSRPLQQVLSDWTTQLFAKLRRNCVQIWQRYGAPSLSQLSGALLNILRPAGGQQTEASNVTALSPTPAHRRKPPQAPKPVAAASPTASVSQEGSDDSDSPHHTDG